MRKKALVAVAFSLLLLVADACTGGMEQGEMPAIQPDPGSLATPQPQPVGPATTQPEAAEPPVPTTPGGEAVKLEKVADGFRLTFPPRVAFEWKGERKMRQYEFYFIDGHPGTWVVDLDKESVTQTSAPMVQSYFGRGAPYQLPDGRWLAVTGNIQNETHLEFVIEDRAAGTIEELGGWDGRGVVQIAPAGDTVVAYAEFSRDDRRYLGALWQYDWRTRVRTQIADEGMVIGLLPDGRVVGQRGESIGELFTWRPADPAKTAAISLPEVQPYLAKVLPGGKYLAYFISAEAKVSWWGAKTAYASPQRSSLPPRPPVKALAIYDVASSKTRVTDLPVTAQVYWGGNDPAGNPVFVLGDNSGGVFLRVDAHGELAELYRYEGKTSLYGWDRCAMLVTREKQIYRVRTAGCPLEPGETLLASTDRALVGNWLIAFPATNGAEFLDTHAGKWYQAPGLRLPAMISSDWRFETFRPESGYVAFREPGTAQAVYHIVKVEPLGR